MRDDEPAPLSDDERERFATCADEVLAAIGSSDSGILSPAQSKAFVIASMQASVIVPCSPEEQRSIDKAMVQRALNEPKTLAAAAELHEAAQVLARRRAKDCPGGKRMRFTSVLYGIDPETSERIAADIESGANELGPPGEITADEWRETARVQRALIALAERVCLLPPGEQPAPVDLDDGDVPF